MKARRSVTHLTFADTFWRAVLTFLVLLRTEAGGTPAFQSFAASRQFFGVVAISATKNLIVFFN
jgi:hypothetical protein